MRKEFKFNSRENLVEFLSNLARDGWVINNLETYILDGSTTVYVGYKN